MLPQFPVDHSDRAQFLGCPVHLYDMRETCGLIASAMRRRQRLQHVAINVAKLVAMQRDPLLERDVIDSDIISIDGMGILWGCRLLGLPATARVTGIDLMLEVLKTCEVQGFRPYFLGAKPNVLERFIAELKLRCPNLNIAGYRDGYFRREEEATIAAEIRALRPDCLFIAISSPIKERFLHTYRDQMEVPFLMGVGGAIDIFAGHVSRAPLWMQSAGLEWLFRLAQEPRRMWRRYLLSNAEYALLLCRAIIWRSWAQQR